MEIERRNNQKMMKDANEEPESWDDWCKYITNVAKRVCGISKVVIIKKQHGGGMKK